MHLITFLAVKAALSLSVPRSGGICWCWSWGRMTWSVAVRLSRGRSGWVRVSSGWRLDAERLVPIGIASADAARVHVRIERGLRSFHERHPHANEDPAGGVDGRSKSGTSSDRPPLRGPSWATKWPTCTAGSPCRTWRSHPLGSGRRSSGAGSCPADTGDKCSTWPPAGHQNPGEGFALQIGFQIRP